MVSNITDEILSTKPGRSSPKIVITNCFIIVLF
eukprot:UN20191